MEGVEKRGARRGPSPAAVLLAILLLGIVGLVVVHLTGKGWISPVWLADCLTGRMFLMFALVTLVSAGLLVAMLAMLRRAAQANRRKPAGEEGTAMLEFALALPIALILVMIMAQSALLMVGNLCVHYASYCAARCAVVTVPQPGGYVTKGGFQEPTGVNELQSGDQVKGPRILAAAVWAVLPVSCSSTDVPESIDTPVLTAGLQSYFTRYGGTTPYWVTAHLGRKLSYALANTQVEVKPPLNGPAFGPREDIEVVVRHNFYMAIPYANRLFAALGSADNIRLPFGQNEWAMAMTARCRLTNEGEQNYVDIETFPSN